MSCSTRHPHRIVLALPTVLVFGTVLGGMAVAAPGKDSASCRIHMARDGGTITLTALAEADRNLSGSYTFHVAGSGRGDGTDIRQGGAFRAAPGRPARLGTVALGASGGPYDVDLELDVDGETIACSKRTGGI